MKSSGITAKRNPDVNPRRRTAEAGSAGSTKHVVFVPGRRLFTTSHFPADPLEDVPGLNEYRFEVCRRPSASYSNVTSML